jgi:UDP-N-acetylmuramoylalanine--D-glutamate ligase
MVRAHRPFDDSKATNVDAAIHALRSFERPVVWIAGGEDKGSPLEPLVECAARRVRSAVLIGRAAERFAAALAPRVAVERAVDMAQAVQRAAALAQPGDVVLLSPACASFDMYRDFEERGAAFQTEVRRLPGYSEPARPLATIRDEE